jgi:hypothetical protein
MNITARDRGALCRIAGSKKGEKCLYILQAKIN